MNDLSSMHDCRDRAVAGRRRVQAGAGSAAFGFKRWSTPSSCPTARTGSRDPADARPWLVDNDLLAPDADLDDADLELVRGVREALRALLVRNGGGPSPTDPASLAPLRA